MSGDGSQPKITWLLAGGRRCNAGAVTQSVCRVMETDVLPLSVLEGEGMEKLVGYLEPEYVMPWGAPVTKRIEKTLAVPKLIESMERRTKRKAPLSCI